MKLYMTPAQINKMPKKDLANFAIQVQSILYFDGDNDVLDPNKEWDDAADFLEMIADQCRCFGLAPTEITPSR